MYVICYDISNTKRRNKVFKKLKNYGKHMQLSVFECDIPEKQLKKLMKELEKIMGDEEDWSILIYSLCERCREKMILLGRIEDDGDVVIIG